MCPAGIDLSSVGPVRDRDCAQRPILRDLEHGRDILEYSGGPGEGHAHLQASGEYAGGSTPSGRWGPFEHEDHFGRNCL